MKKLSPKSGAASARASVTSAKKEDTKLDEELRQSFPASDPPAVTRPSGKKGDSWGGSRMNRRAPVVSGSAEGQPDADRKKPTSH